jgi:hypothetical protein
MSAIDFSLVTSIQIPNGDVSKISKFDGENEIVLWELSNDLITYFDSEEGYNGQSGAGTYTFNLKRGTYTVIVVGCGGDSSYYRLVNSDDAANSYSTGSGGSGAYCKCTLVIKKNSIITINNQNLNTDATNYIFSTISVDNTTILSVPSGKASSDSNSGSGGLASYITYDQEYVTILETTNGADGAVGRQTWSGGYSSGCDSVETASSYENGLGRGRGANSYYREFGKIGENYRGYVKIFNN